MTDPVRDEQTPNNAPNMESDPADEDANPIGDALDSDDDALLRSSLADIHPADFSDMFEQLSNEQRLTLVHRAPDLITADVLAELEDEVVEEILPELPSTQLSEAIGEMELDDATQVIEEMEDEQREEVLLALEPEDRAAIEASLSFDEESIGRLMQREFVAAPPFWTVGQTIDHMRQAGENLPDLFFNIWIIDAAFHPIGYVPVSQLMRSGRDKTLAELFDDKLITIDENMDKEEAAFLFEKYHLISAPVTDSTGRLRGMMTVDDIIDIIQDENKEDLLALAGVNESSLTDTALSTVRARAPWLFINLLTAILASFVIAAYETIISEVVQLAILMPIVASMGGNAGTQTLAVAVRALAERDLTARNAWRSVRREAVAALLNGLIFATLLALIVWLWFSRTDIALIAFVAMIINHVCAGLAGILIPLGLKRFGADPAVSSSVFVTTVTDVVGFFAFLGFAAFMLT